MSTDSPLSLRVTGSYLEPADKEGKQLCREGRTAFPQEPVLESNPRVWLSLNATYGFHVCEPSSLTLY